MDFLVGFYAKYAPGIRPIPDELCRVPRGGGQEHRLSRGALTREGLGDRNDSICM